ncbi:hypothetical protein TrVE_jg6820 [Triparma verrucosa]|uniref:Uncharacterized protein n=1 Tax=Triparma verrucosa TaxID=1606542 RepID=A0A9W7BIZ1_9STRA|nr:hypothetical protein TrVE_jg6820 [Triparma verrucosa]
MRDAGKCAFQTTFHSSRPRPSTRSPLHSNYLPFSKCLTPARSLFTSPLSELPLDVTTAATFEPVGLSPPTIIALTVVCLVPFAWATYEFWTRIANGQQFGTGKDSITIGIPDDPKKSRGTRVLGQGALNTAYVLFAISGFVLAVSFYSALDLTNTGPLPDYAEVPKLSPAEALVGLVFKPPQ